MKDFEGKVAVVTGAAGGIGRAVAELLAKQGMKLALADIDLNALEEVAAQLRSNGTEVIAVQTDVSKLEQIEALAAATMDAYGAVHVVHNNAGVVTAGLLDELTQHDWEWVLGVDLWSVIWGVQTFLPLIKASGEGHFVNTASTAGIQSNPAIGPYNVAKFGVVALTETLALELAGLPLINASVLCPGAVNTGITSSDRNRPDDLNEHKETAAGAAFVKGSTELLESKGMTPGEVADIVLDGIVNERFWLITHEPWKDIALKRAEALARDGSLYTGFGG